MTRFTSAVLVVAALSLVACSEGEDVYVTGPSTSSSSSSALECVIEPGANVCDRTFSSVSFDERARTLDTLQAVSDFAWVAEAAVSDVERACRGIATEVTGAPPAVAPEATPQQRLSMACSAARDAVLSAEQGALHIEVASVTCSQWGPRSCSTTAQAALPTSCAAPSVAVTALPGASATSLAVADALSRHYGALATLKSRLEALSAISGPITGNADLLTNLPAGCIVSSTKLTSDAVAAVQAATTVAVQMNDATAWVSR